MIDDVFPHIGETILERIINHDSGYLLEKLGLTEHGFVAVHRQIPIVFPSTNVIFDGFSTIDLGLQFDDGTIFPIEVKLGQTGLARATINQKLTPCTLSAHTSEARISGNILAVLNRYFDNQLSDLIATDSLHAWINNQLYTVKAEWGIIARSRILASWLSYPPNFNGYQRTLSLEPLCSIYGRDAFNSLVKDMLSEVDYFKRWIGKNA